jgi:AcrR family transcriptional regulator
MKRVAKPSSNGHAEANRKEPVFDKGRRTRQRLLSAAERVFERDGFLEARIADIAKSARVSYGTFYTYFDSKEEIFREVASAVIDDMYESLDVVAEGQGALDLIPAANEVFIGLYERHASMLALIEQVATFDEHFRQARLDLRRRLVKRVEHAVARMSASGETSLEGLEPRVLAHALGGMTENFAYAWFILEEPFDREAALATLNAIWVRVLGIRTDERQRSVSAVNSADAAR